MKPQKTFSSPLKTWSRTREKSVQKCAPDDKSFKSTAGMLESKNSCRTTIWSSRAELKVLLRSSPMQNSEREREEGSCNGCNDEKSYQN